RIPAVTRVAQLTIQLSEGVAACRRPGSSRRAHLSGPPGYHRGLLDPQLSGDMGVGPTLEQRQIRLNCRVGPGHPLATRAEQRRNPDLERPGKAGDVLPSDAVAPGCESHGLLQGDRGAVGDVLRGGVSQTSWAGLADGRVDLYRVVYCGPCQHLAKPITEGPLLLQRGAGQRRQQQHDAEVGVGASPAQRVFHRTPDGSPQGSRIRLRQSWSDGYGAGQEILITGVVKMTIGRHVAGFGRADLQETSELPGGSNLRRRDHSLRAARWSSRAPATSRPVASCNPFQPGIPLT